MKKLLILAAMLTVGTYSANAQTGTTTTTTRKTTTMPATTTTSPMTGTTTETTPSSTTMESTTTTAAPATPAPGTITVPADAKVKSNGKKMKIK